jgi:hypothetical protein
VSDDERRRAEQLRCLRNLQGLKQLLEKIRQDVEKVVLAIRSWRKPRQEMKIGLMSICDRRSGMEEGALSKVSISHDWACGLSYRFPFLRDSKIYFDISSSPTPTAFLWHLAFSGQVAEAGFLFRDQGGLLKAYIMLVFFVWARMDG